MTTQSWFEVKRFSIDTDLSKIHQFLIHEGIAHRFMEEGADQVLWMNDLASAKAVMLFIDRFLQGEFELTDQQNILQPSKSYLFQFTQYIYKSPITSVLLLFGFLGYVSISLLSSDTLFRFLQYASLSSVLSDGQIWRLFSPVFMHFGGMHFIFNALWLHLLGRPLEQRLGCFSYLLMMLFITLCSNSLQYYLTYSSAFGGLSGLVYGCVGAFCIAQWVLKDPRLKIQNGILIFSLVMLFFGFSSTFQFVLGIGIANWAHLGGLLSGMVISFIFLKFSK